MRMTTTALTAIVIGGLLSFGIAAFAQPPEPRPPAPPAQPPAQPASPAQPPQTAAPADTQSERREPNVLLEDLLRRVGAETGLNFVVDPRAPPRVHVGGTLEATPSYEQLRLILRSHSLMAVEAGGVVHIMPDAMARAVPTRIVQTDNDSIPDDEIVTRVITLPEDVQAAQLVPVLRPMMPQNAHFAALLPPSPNGRGANKVVIVDSYANVKRITEVIRLIVGSVSF